MLGGEVSGMGHQQFAEEEEDERRERAEQRARVAESKAASRSFPRLRLNVTQLSPGYVSCSAFQSDNAGTNWACVGTDLTFPEDWFQQTFGAAEEGRRVEFEIVGVHEVTS